MQLSVVAYTVESSDNDYAMRFEPASYASNPQWIEGQESAIAHFNDCSDETARMIACTSWGRFQILGANIYALGHTSSIINWINGSTRNDGDLQDNTYRKFIQPKGFQPFENCATWADSRFNAYAGFYNGPGNIPAYITLMKRVISASCQVTPSPKLNTTV